MTDLTTALDLDTTALESALVEHASEFDSFFTFLEDADPIRNQTDTRYRAQVAQALATAQDGNCALCLEEFRTSAITGQYVCNLENVTGTLAHDLNEGERDDYKFGGIVALHGDCNSNHHARQRWMRRNGVTHHRLTETAMALAGVRV